MYPEISFLLRFRNSYDGFMFNQPFELSVRDPHHLSALNFDISFQGDSLYIGGNYAGKVPVITQMMRVPYGSQAVEESQVLTELENYCKILDSKNSSGVSGIVDKQVTENIRKIIMEVKQNV